MHTLDHNSVVCCVKFSGDGKYMATGCNKSAQVYDIETGEKVQYVILVLNLSSNIFFFLVHFLKILEKMEIYIFEVFVLVLMVDI